ncbi:peptidylprolyl isomerase [Sediminicoccus rosea]|jgi:peptidyl-prolyl cis-trans isomerase C|uniref:Parvulin-like PPIase n=1 Tax=Sediminicoccus rosea TaxID=1225128 RepID=A0ABZ0PJR1_9PROT|nr:peptidylprolyl isomerase [Sediminicoccus rosea]WPB85632.1 peptidylprolyl isomerase [Sediminicoccus rosea]
MSRFSLPLALMLAAGPALAQAPAPARPPAAAPAPAATPAPAAAAEDSNPVLARVNGEDLRLDEVMATAAEAMPAELRSVPPALLRTMLPPQVFEQLLDRAITDRAMVAAARTAGLDQDPEIRRRVRLAEENELRDALLRREVLPRVTEDLLRARYERDAANRSAEQEVRARHILVANEADARAILAEIQRGANFEEVARRRSTDPAARNGGDLGFFRQGDMVPEFAAAAFALQPGQVSPAPVRTQFGWHVIKVEERRTSSGPTFEESRDTLRQALVEEEVLAAVQRIRAASRIERVEPPAPPAPAIQAEPPAPARPAAPAPATRR